ncbi:MAG: hypothetical protein ACRCWI_05865 [Brevinema sp.]
MNDKILLQAKNTKLIVGESEISLETKDGTKIELGDKIVLQNNTGSSVVVDTQLEIKSGMGNLKDILSEIGNFLPTINTLGSPMAQNLNPALIPKCIEISTKIPMVLK